MLQRRERGRVIPHAHPPAHENLSFIFFGTGSKFVRTIFGILLANYLGQTWPGKNCRTSAELEVRVTVINELRFTK